LDAVDNGAIDGFWISGDAAFGGLVFPASDGAGKDDFSLAIKRLKAKTKPETGGGLDSLVELLVVHVDIFEKILREMSSEKFVIN
jgi:hypothetical protein